MVGVVVWVVARCATGPHPSPLPPSGRGDGCYLRGYCGEWGVGAVREPPLRVGRRERGWLLRLRVLG